MNNPSSIDILLTYPGDGLRLFQSMIPVGLVSIGTVLRNAGYSVKIIDFNHYSRDFRRDLIKLNPKIVGIGGTTPTRQGSFLTAHIVKEILPSVPVIYGGVNATFTALETLKSISCIDYIIKGEGELSFLELCNCITGKSLAAVDQISGLCCRTSAGIIENKPCRINDLSVLPVSDRDLVGDNYKLKMEFIGGEGDFIMTSRGCPAACNFCSASQMFPGGVRTRPIDSVMTEVEYLLSRKNLSGLKLFDSTFTAKRDHVLNFCKHIQPFSIPWECEIRADTVDYDLLRIMKESGCYYVNMGMETSNVNHLKKIAKGISPEQVLDVLTMCKKLAIRSKVFFTFGHPGQTLSECRDDIRFIEKHRKQIDFFAVTVGMRIYPGTRLESESRKNNVLKHDLRWIGSHKSIKNLLLFEPGDIPLLFQKQLGPVKLSIVLVTLIWKRLVCTEQFIYNMAIENTAGFLKIVRLQLLYTSHRISRMIDRRWIEKSTS